MKILAFGIIFTSVALALITSEVLGPKDTIPTYKIVYDAQNWTTARDMCAADGEKLAVPKSKEEFQTIQKMVRKMFYPNITGATDKTVQFLVWLGISNLEDHRIWKNVDGENIEDTGFHEWAGDNGQDTRPDIREPHCVVVDAVNPGLRDFWCNYRQTYVCEKAERHSDKRQEE